ncbi:MAG: aminotransferase class I/II-fold pyridoxal phosphate-dependent enzyme [Gammaproteobacteria bacterium]|nr:aminotransferase class I/II-fold pyridoxal phosphate-dependent enzyme [Gammaproteobacteria bacterium]
MFTKSFDTPNPIPDEAIDAAVALMKHGMLYRYGHVDEAHKSDDGLPADASEVSKLEQVFCDYTGHKYAVAVNSCGSAMFIALKAMGIKQGDKVLTNAFTFTAVPSSIVHAGGVPVYVECTRQYVVDLQSLNAQIEANPDINYFILSHMRGHVAELDKIKTLCDEHHIRLIEDCAHGLGKRWNTDNHGNKEGFVGHHCEIACYSSQSHKMLNSGEGGFIATNDDQLAAYCILAAGSYEQLYKKHLARPADDQLFEAIKFQVPNFSLRMNNLIAAVLRPQVALIDERIASYKNKYERIIEILSVSVKLDIPAPVVGTENVGDSLQFTLLGFDQAKKERFIAKTAARGVVIQIFGTLENARDFRNWKYSFEEVPAMHNTAEIISYTCDLRLPLTFTLEDIEQIGAIILDSL